MSTTQLTLLLIGIYLLSAFLFWLYLRIIYSKRGKWYNIRNQISTADLWFTFLPIVNTICSVCFWLFNFPIKTNLIILTNILKKIFRIKD
jgi:hypothetical protein